MSSFCVLGTIISYVYLLPFGFATPSEKRKGIPKSSASPRNDVGRDEDGACADLHDDDGHVVVGTLRRCHHAKEKTIMTEMRGTSLRGPLIILIMMPSWDGLAETGEASVSRQVEKDISR